MPAGDRAQGQRQGGGTVIGHFRNFVRRLRCRPHAWQTVEMIPSVEVLPARARALLRQRCGVCLAWRLRFDDGTEPSRKFKAALDICLRNDLVRFEPYDLGRGFADRDAEPTELANPVESRHAE